VEWQSFAERDFFALIQLRREKIKVGRGTKKVKKLEVYKVVEKSSKAVSR